MWNIQGELSNFEQFIISPHKRWWDLIVKWEGNFPIFNSLSCEKSLRESNHDRNQWRMDGTSEKSWVEQTFVFILQKVPVKFPINCEWIFSYILCNFLNLVNFKLQPRKNGPIKYWTLNLKSWEEGNHAESSCIHSIILNL